MSELISSRELSPADGHKSFYGKAYVKAFADGDEVLHSYGTPVLRRNADGTLVRLWNGWSATTGRHILAFCGIHKADFLALPCEG